MKVSYFPGCSLEGTGLEYAESTEAVCEKLGTELVELDDWSCCGASSAHSAGKELAVEVAARNLKIAEKSGLKDLVIPCSACFQRTKVAEYDLSKHPESFPDVEYNGNVKVKDLLSYISQDVGIEKIKSNISKKLDGLKAACYYGCLTSRHPEIVEAVDYEDPKDMDILLTELGVDVVPWSYKTDCCGGSLVLSSTDIVLELCKKLYDKAIEAGAECLVTLCPLCQGNLDQRQGEISAKYGKKYDLPTFYFTELMGLAMGDSNTGTWFNRHLVDPTKLLKSKKLI